MGQLGIRHIVAELACMDAEVMAKSARGKFLSQQPLQSSLHMYTRKRRSSLHLQAPSARAFQRKMRSSNCWMFRTMPSSAQLRRLKVKSNLNENYRWPWQACDDIE